MVGNIAPAAYLCPNRTYSCVIVVLPGLFSGRFAKQIAHGEALYYMTIVENNCHVEIRDHSITCACGQPGKSRPYSWSMDLQEHQLIYQKSGKVRRVYDMDSVEELQFVVDPVKGRDSGEGHVATAYVRMSGDLSSVKLCRLMVQDKAAEFSDTKAYKVMNRIVDELSDKYAVSATYARSVLTQDKLSKMIKTMIVLSGVVLAFALMALLTH